MWLKRSSGDLNENGLMPGGDDNGLSPAAGEVLLVTRDSIVTTRLRADCVARGLRVVESEPELSSPPRLVAVDLADPAAL